MRKTVACLLLLLQLAFPLALTAGVRGADRAAEARLAGIVAAGEPVLLRLEDLNLSQMEDGRYYVRFTVFFPVKDPYNETQRGGYIPLRGGGEGRYYLSEAVTAPPRDVTYITYNSYRTELLYAEYLLSAENAEALANSAGGKTEEPGWIWFEGPGEKVFLSTRLLNGGIAVAGLWANGTEYPMEKQTAVN